MTDIPAPEDASSSPEFLPAPAEEASAAPRARKVYESNLLPDRRRRVSPWLWIPGLAVGFGLGYYFLLYAPQKRRQIPTAGQIVFASDRNTPGVAHLWILPAGGAARPLTGGASADTAPAFAPDGNQIAFVSPRILGQSQVHVIDSDGKNITPVTHTSGTKDLLSFAPSDNHLLAYTAGGVLYQMDLGSKSIDQIAPPNADPAHNHTSGTEDAQLQATAVPSYAWRPGAARDEQGLAAVLDTDNVQTLAVLPKPEAKLVTTSTGQAGGPPLIAADALSIGWSPSGGILAAAALGIKNLPGGAALSAIILFDGEGKPMQSPPPIHIPSAVVGPENPVFTPDGAAIVVEVWRQPDIASRKCLGLFVVNTDASGQPRRVASGDAEHARISRDGKTVYYLSVRSDGKHDLCSAGIDGTGFQRLSDGVEDVTRFDLSPQ